MTSKKPDSRRRIKDQLARLLTVGAGSLVVATTVVSAPAAASPQPPSQPVLQRAEAVRAKITTDDVHRQPRERVAGQLAWWRNWGNGGWAPHPYWHNWPNWQPMSTWERLGNRCKRNGE